MTLNVISQRLKCQYIKTMNCSLGKLNKVALLYCYWLSYVWCTMAFFLMIMWYDSPQDERMVTIFDILECRIKINSTINSIRTNEQIEVRKNGKLINKRKHYHRVCNQINTTGVTSGAGTFYPSGAPEFTSDFQWGSCYSIFSFIYMFC